MISKGFYFSCKIEKNKGDRDFKNWRPISLLNVDYKIASKALALRLKKVLSAIINNAQTGYVEGRFIGENIRLISDILNFTADQDIEGIALFIDFEKAFDSFEWEYLFKALDIFQFGPDFKTWVKILYTNIFSCIINNGFASEPFTPKRGVRQGCPLSGLLFILAAELLSCSVRANDHIKGIRVSNKEIKLSQYADDTTSFCKDIESLGKLLELLDLFKYGSGLKLNQSKSEAMWLGKNANKTDTLFGVQCSPQRPISALGISFSYNLKLCKQENFLQKVSKIQKLFNIWSQRDLSLYGKITIPKTLGLSKLIFVSACIHTLPHYIDIINRLTTNFVWNNKKPKIKRDTLIGPKDRGGLDLPEFEIVSKSLQTAWVKRMKNGVGDQWMSIPLFYLKNVGGPFIFDCDYDVKFLGLNNIYQHFTLMFLMPGRRSESKLRTMKSPFEVLSWWKNNGGENLLFDDLSVMYGYNPEDPKTHILNYFILLGKRHIFLQRSEFKPPSFDHFLEFVKDKVIGKDRFYTPKDKKENFFHCGSLSSSYSNLL